jgi:hypothetical protein
MRRDKYPLFILAVLLWAFSLRDFLFKPLTLIVDAAVCFVSNNYYLSNLSRGVFPSWNPFNFWGRTDDFNVLINSQLNPLLYLVFLLTHLSVNFSTAYFIYIMVYFFLGLAGLYCLAQRIFKEFWMAYLAFILFLFSNIWNNVFNDFIVIMILTPSIWFFYFLISFLQEGKKRNWWGLIVTTAVLATTYIPFMFLTVFLIAAIVLCATYVDRLGQSFSVVKAFVQKQYGICLAGVSLLAAAIVPGTLWFLESKNSYFGWRGEDPMSMGTSVINANAAIGPNSIELLFAGQTLQNLDVYMPFCIFIIFALGILVPLRRTNVALAVIALSLFLFTLGGGTPFYGLLNHVFGFLKYFRNLHFLEWFYVPAVILFCVGQFGLWVEKCERLSKSGQRWMLLFLILVHGGLIIFLRTFSDVTVTSWIVLAGSFCFLVAVMYRKLKTSTLTFLISLLLLVSIQPIEVLSSMGKRWKVFNFEAGKHPLPVNLKSPVFSYTRPFQGQDKPIEGGGFGEYEDMSGYLEPAHAYGLKWSAVLQKNIPYEDLKEYVHHKFVIYDNVKSIDDIKELPQVCQAIRQKQNIAFVSEAANVPKISQNPANQLEFIEKDSPQFQVTSFDLNSIKFITNFSSPKFLVYNDSFHKGWQATINGNRVPIYRANIAFKGIELPEGRNEVTLVYYPERQILFFLIISLFLSAFFYLVYLCIKLK